MPRHRDNHSPYRLSKILASHPAGEHFLSDNIYSPLRTALLRAMNFPRDNNNQHYILQSRYRSSKNSIRHSTSVPLTKSTRREGVVHLSKFSSPETGFAVVLAPTVAVVARLASSLSVMSRNSSTHYTQRRYISMASNKMPRQRELQLESM